MDDISYDLVIRGGTVYDGTGAAGRRADVGFRGERVTFVGDLARASGPTLDATGLAIAPGFIDVHTHDDFAALLHPDMAFKVLGGVTTCVVGNCGMGTAPYDAAKLMARAFHPKATLPEWAGTEGYLALLEREPASVNIGALVGHGCLRIGAMGGSRQAPNDTQLAAMRDELAAGLETGALGMSTGLVYEPGCYAETGEIVELAGEMTDRGGLYATHMRNEGDHLLDSVREAIEIGERAGVPVQISHHKAAGRENWGRVRDSLVLIDEARQRGVDVHADQYPYTAGSTVLAAVAKSGALADGAGSGGLGVVRGEDVVLASAPEHPAWEGRSLADFSSELGATPQQAAEHVLEQEPLATIIIHSMDETDVRTVMRHPTTMIGSDGIPTLEGRPHPRLYGTFARVLGRYVRELGLLGLEEAIHRMTGLSARKFHLRDRGVVRPGAFADLVIFDPDAILDLGSFEEPHQAPTGIQHVFVNGVHVVRDAAHTGARSGHALRRAN